LRQALKDKMRVATLLILNIRKNLTVIWVKVRRRKSLEKILSNSVSIRTLEMETKSTSRQKKTLLLAPNG